MTVKSDTETKGLLRQIVTVNAHTLQADVGTEPTSAPSPHDYFDVSLATCKAITAGLYAKARNMALDKIHVEVERDATEERQGTYVLSVKVTFEGALTDAEKEKLHDVLTRCPIHKLMTTSTVDIRTLPLAL